MKKPIANVIYRWDQGFKVSSDRLEKPGTEPVTPGYVSGLPTTPQQLSSLACINTEVSSIILELSGARCTEAMLNILQIKIGTRTTSACERSHC